MWPRQYKTKAGLRYLIMDRDQNGEKVRVAGPFEWTSRREADNRIRELERELARVPTPGGRSERVSVAPLYGEWVQEWLADHQPLGIKHSTRERYVDAVRTYLAPYFAHHRLDEIDAKAILAWQRDLYEVGNVKAPPSPIDERVSPPRPLSPRTINQALRLLRASLQTAVVEGKIAYNPARSVDALAVPKKRHGRVLDVNLVWELAGYLRERDGGLFHAFVLIAAYCGLRVGELGALLASHVDLDRQVISVQRTLAHDRHGYYVDPKPKTVSSEAEVPIPPLIFDAVRWHMENHVREVPMLHLQAGRNGQKTRIEVIEQVVFSSVKGHMFNPNHFRRDRWNPGLRSLGVTTRTRIHDLRHTVTTHAARVADSSADARDFARHSSIAITDDYLHSDLEQARVLAARLPGPTNPELLKPDWYR